MARVTDRGPCRAGLARVGVFVVGMLVLGLIFSALITPWIHLSWWKVFRRCVSIAAAISLWWIVTCLERRTLRSYGFLNWGVGARQLTFGMKLGAMCLVSLFALGLTVGIYKLHITQPHVKIWLTVVSFIPAALLIGILEELVFRGFILQQLMTCSRPLAVLLSTTAYSFIHLRMSTFSLSTALELGGLFLLGGILALSYLRTHQLYFAVGLHSVLAYGAIVNKLFIECPYPSISWLVGTNRLINGLLGWGILLGIGGLIAQWKEPSNQGRVRDANA